MTNCAVCLAQIDLVPVHGVASATARTACGHDFHLSCLVRCLEYQGTSCPICRQSIDEELASAPRAWMSSPPGHSGERPASPRGGTGGTGGGPLASLAAVEAAVAVEIAESVRRSLAEDEAARRGSFGTTVASAAGGHTGATGMVSAPPGPFGDEDEPSEAVVQDHVATNPRQHEQRQPPRRRAPQQVSPSEAEAGLSPPPVWLIPPTPSSIAANDGITGASRRSRSRADSPSLGSLDFAMEVRRYAEEVAAAVARNLAEERLQRQRQHVQRPTGPAALNAPAGQQELPRLELEDLDAEAGGVASATGAAVDLGVDPGALAGLEEAVVRIHDANLQRARRARGARREAARAERGERRPRCERRPRFATGERAAAETGEVEERLLRTRLLDRLQLEIWDEAEEDFMVQEADEETSEPTGVGRHVDAGDSVNLGLGLGDFNVSDVVSVARAVLQSLDEEAATATAT
eukprot:gnl/TRDRNA2_/TRDRNA2_82984_c0_seq1.p1 gnl/TRDRNA2_/TRDRNA2_82984_c0~~gnl/TRDRNA2_/TRDRNA2_82984_c0_seq1.p1  ORF type:complete len:464 (-),score=87.79 gnl/TRDRNA2_/TRDRNA2_82984_c0_seq1:64-1455(-)